MATKPTVIANQKPREVRFDAAGRRASAPVGDGQTGAVRQVGTSNTAVPGQQHTDTDAGPMVVRPSVKLTVAALPPELLAAMTKANEQAAKPKQVAQEAVSTAGLDFSARIQKLKAHNAALKQQMVTLQRQPVASKAATPKAQSLIKALSARRKVT